MIVSTNSTPQKDIFEDVIANALKELNLIAKASPARYKELSGNKLEPFVGEVMTSAAVGTEFENSIEVLGGQVFPDIVANRLYGVEVKTTIKDHWRTTGNSVLESTRIDSVERIYMLFGKLAAPIEFRCKPYEECLSEVVVTHSPRYLVDMNIKQGETIFNKINIPYDTVRKGKNPIRPFIDYYKKVNDGGDAWWMDNVTSLVLRIWANLPPIERMAFINTASVLFPEIYGNSLMKFSRIASWLVTKHGVICPNVRDAFSAGGKDDLIIKRKKYSNVPRIIVNLFQSLPGIIDQLDRTSASELNEYWEVKTSSKNKSSDWINLVSIYSKTLRGNAHLDVKSMLESAIS